MQSDFFFSAPPFPIPKQLYLHCITTTTNATQVAAAINKPITNAPDMFQSAAGVGVVCVVFIA
jgi:hypothetical protein